MPHVMNVDSNNKLAMQGYCPVSYQFGPVPEMGLPEESSEYEGAIYRFSSTKGKELFDAQPAKYAPLYGGWCGTGMAHGSLTPIDPLNYKIVGDDKKLVLFFKNDELNTLDIWNKDEPGTKAKADNNWATDSYAAAK